MLVNTSIQSNQQTPYINWLLEFTSMTEPVILLSQAPTQVR